MFQKPFEISNSTLILYHFLGLPNTEEGISDDLYKELDKLIEENTPYEVEILSVGDAVYYVNIPSVYDKLKNI